MQSTFEKNLKRQRAKGILTSSKSPATQRPALSRSRNAGPNTATFRRSEAEAVSFAQRNFAQSLEYHTKIHLPKTQPQPFTR